MPSPLQPLTPAETLARLRELKAIAASRAGRQVEPQPASRPADEERPRFRSELGVCPHLARVEGCSSCDRRARAQQIEAALFRRPRRARTSDLVTTPHVGDTSALSSGIEDRAAPAAAQVGAASPRGVRVSADPRRDGEGNADALDTADTSSSSGSRSTSSDTTSSCRGKIDRVDEDQALERAPAPTADPSPGRASAPTLPAPEGGTGRDSPPDAPVPPGPPWGLLLELLSPPVDPVAAELRSLRASAIGVVAGAERALTCPLVVRIGRSSISSAGRAGDDRDDDPPRVGIGAVVNLSRQGGTVPAGAHNPGRVGSTPTSATSRRPALTPGRLGGVLALPRQGVRRPGALPGHKGRSVPNWRAPSPPRRAILTNLGPAASDLRRKGRRASSARGPPAAVDSS